ncbi:regulator [Cryobacterium sp. TMS1-20-1]|uniref:AAA family ATPase n=1 Tax=unclassified Cryobacterium TaxID=2649013 RepID=UPI00106C395F|nr:MULTISPECIES: regulator [unclassified Cryobacterium]TFC80218.1 regulator [Cryobacterium sp. TMS1-20-1]TFD48203.1 regulator [Cryobacterium sp. Hh11]TFD56856.1 regulator [Cryobacterium sp. Hh7]
MARIALVLDRTTEQRMLADIIECGHSVVTRVDTARDFLESLSHGQPHVVVVSGRRESLTGQLIAACDERGIRVVAIAASEQERRHAGSLGLYETVALPCDWAEIEDLLVSGVVVPLRVGDRHFTGGALSAGSVIAVWGPSGAPGRTTLAINIAAEIAAAGHTVVLADVDTYGASIAPRLGMLDEAPGFAAACRLAGSDSLNRSELERIAQRYNSPKGAFWVLTGLGRPSRWPELSTERVTRTIDALRHWVDYVVLDTGFNLESDEELSSDLLAPRRNAATVTALRMADHVVACGLADPIGMARFLRSWVDLAEVTTGRAVSVVINQVRASALGLNPRGQVLRTLKLLGNIDSAVLVPHDQVALDTAVLTGHTLRDGAPKSPARVSIRRFVLDELIVVAVGQTERVPRRVRWPGRKAAPAI